MRQLVVTVRRNELQTKNVTIAPHELPVLAYVHGEEACTVIGELVLDEIECAGAAEEFSRLAQKYGRDKANESLEPRVAAVYGAGPRGLIALQEAIDIGQDLEVPGETFKLGAGEPSHEAKGSILQKTQFRPLAHTGPQAPAKRSKPVQARALKSAVDADHVRNLPPAMQPGASQAKHTSTAKAKRNQQQDQGSPQRQAGR